MRLGVLLGIAAVCLSTAGCATDEEQVIPPVVLGRMKRVNPNHASIDPPATPCAPKAASFSKFMLKGASTGRMCRGGRGERLRVWSERRAMVATEPRAAQASVPR